MIEEGAFTEEELRIADESRYQLLRDLAEQE